MNITALNIFKSISNPILDFIYPPACITCNNIQSENGERICKKCWDSIPTLTKEHPLYLDTYSKLTADGFISNLISCYIFEKEGHFQHIAHALKYQEFKSLGIELGKRIGQKMLDWNISADIVVPVPLHKIKHRERGYNQSECIAKGIAVILNKPIVTNLLQRTRHTQTQTKLNFHERKRNMKDAFEIIPTNSYLLQAKSCLLVDDVITTGATINSCAKELLSAGGMMVIAASAALAK